MSEQLDRIKTVVSAVLDVPLSVVTIDTTASELENWDSLGQMNLMLALEEEFGLQFTPEQITNLHSVREIDEAVSQGA